MKLCLVWLIFLLFFIPKSENAKILGIFHLPVKTTYILGSTLLKELADKGHEVTMLSPFSSKGGSNTYRNIQLEGIMPYKKAVKEILASTNLTFFKKMLLTKKYILELNELVLSSPRVIKLINSGEKFDLIIQSWASSEPLVGLAHTFHAHCIIFNVIGPSYYTNGYNPSSFVYTSNPLFYLPNNMTFFQRGIHTFINTVQEFLHYILIYPEQERLMKKHFPDAPPLLSMLLNISIVLLNSHHSIQSPQSLIPSMVEIGGFHITPSRLTNDVKGFLDTSQEGVILFNLSPNSIKNAKLPQGLINTLNKLPLKVILNVESENFQNNSKVLVNTWLPEKDILAHKNVRAFVTNGGLISATEAVHYGVPLIGIPEFNDQDNIINDAINKGFAVKIDFNNITEDSLVEAVKEIYHNSRYYQNIQGVSKLMRDQPIKPMEKALYWIEYVLNHNGAHHLKTSAFLMQWYHLLDLIVFLAVIGIVVLAFICIIGICVFISCTDNYDNIDAVQDVSDEIEKKQV